MFDWIDEAQRCWRGVVVVTAHLWPAERSRPAREWALAHVWAGVVGLLCGLFVPPVWVAGVVAVDRLDPTVSGLGPAAVLLASLLAMAVVLLLGLRVAQSLRGTLMWMLGFPMGLAMSLVGLGLVI